MNDNWVGESDETGQYLSGSVPNETLGYCSTAPVKRGRGSSRGSVRGNHTFAGQESSDEEETFDRDP